MLEQLGDDAHALLGCLARPVHRFRHALAERAVVVDERVAEVGERQPREARRGLVGRHLAGPDALDQRPQRGIVHSTHGGRLLT